MGRGGKDDQVGALGLLVSFGLGAADKSFRGSAELRESCACLLLSCQPHSSWCHVFHIRQSVSQGWTYPRLSLGAEWKERPEDKIFEYPSLMSLA